MQDTWFLWNLRNHHSRKLQAEHPLPLSAVAARIVEDLTRDGISIVPIEELLPGTTWFQDLTRYGMECERSSFQNTRKTYWIEMWDPKHFLVDLQNPFVRFAVLPEILAIANAYIGMYVRLHSISLSKTIPVAPGTPAIQSQQWHRDIGNKKYLKVFTYFNDIEKDDGPFIYLKGSQPGGKWEHFSPQINPFTPVPGRVPDSVVSEAIPPADILHATGKAGTLIFADTTGLHKGGYSTGNPRLASIITLQSEKTLERRKGRDSQRYPVDFEQSVRDLPLAAHFALKRPKRRIF